jgi:hypothetical protein
MFTALAVGWPVEPLLLGGSVESCRSFVKKGPGKDDDRIKADSDCSCRSLGADAEVGVDSLKIRRKIGADGEAAVDSLESKDPKLAVVPTLDAELLEESRLL